jgi:phage gp46-like protein
MPFQSRPTYDVVPQWNAGTSRHDIAWDTAGTNTGNPTVDDRMGHAVLSRLYSHRGKWWADATGRRGSELYTLKHDTIATPGKVVAFVEDALRPLLDAKKIARPADGIFARATRKRPGVFDIVVTYSLPTGRTAEVRASMSF